LRVNGQELSLTDALQSLPAKAAFEDNATREVRN
jgi:hypothetical protein